MIRVKEVTNGKPMRSRGFQASLSDSEVITMEIVAEFQGIDTDKGIWQYFRRHWFSMFPQMKSRSTFVRQAANLWQYKQELQQVLAIELGAFSDNTHIIDGIPIPSVIDSHIENGEPSDKIGCIRSFMQTVGKVIRYDYTS